MSANKNHYTDPVAAYQADQWLKRGDVLRLGDEGVTAHGFRELASDPRLVPAVTSISFVNSHFVDSRAARWVETFAEIRHFKRLKTLRLDCCDLVNLASVAKMLADGLTSLTELRELGLSFTGLNGEMLVEVLNCVPNLTNLDIRANELIDTHSLAHALRQVPNLVTLSLSQNPLPNSVALASGLNELRHLEELDLQFAELDDLLPFSPLLPSNGGSLQLLKITGCIALQRRYKLDEAILSLTDPTQIFDLLGNAKNRRLGYLPLVKAMVLGDGGAGKTHLRHRLMGRDPHALGPIASTQSFEIEQFSIPVPDISFGEVEVRLFDFAGQNQLHGAHRLFLSSERNLYIIVCRGDLSPEAAHLTYWLRMVQHHGTTKAPVIVVCSWADQPPHPDWQSWNAGRVEAEFDLKCLWVREYADPPARQGHAGLSFQRRKLAELRTCIEWVVAAMRPILETAYDRGMLNLRRWIEGHGTGIALEEFCGRYVTLAVFETACYHVGASSANEVRLWLKILSHLGCIVYLSDLPETDDPVCRELRGYVFDPNWLKRSLYRLNTPSEWTSHIAFPGAVIPVENVESLLRERQGPNHGLSPEEIRLVLSVARAVRLLFDAKGPGAVSTAYLLVDLLPDEPVCTPLEDQPRLWKRGVTLQLEFLSEAYLPRVIGELQSHLRSKSGSTFRSWVIFSFPGPPRVDILVKVNLNDAIAEFYGKGGGDRDRQRHLDFVREKFRELVVRDGLEAGTPRLERLLGLPPYLQEFIAILTSCRRADRDFDALSVDAQVEAYNWQKRRLHGGDKRTVALLTTETYKRYRRTVEGKLNTPRHDRNSRNFDTPQF